MKKDKVGLMLLCVGILLFALAGMDIISIVLDVLENILNSDLNAPFFASFGFRLAMILFGGLFALIGGLLYKGKNN